MFTGKRYSPMKGLGGYTSKMERKTRGGHSGAQQCRGFQENNSHWGAMRRSPPFVTSPYHDPKHRGHRGLRTVSIESTFAFTQLKDYWIRCGLNTSK